MNQVSLEINRKGAFQVKSQSHEPSPQKGLLGYGPDLGDRSSSTRASRVLGRVSYKAIERLNLRIERLWT
jgi:hypothetical protein